MQILVLGMHRSGTSAFARILNLMGCYVGPEEKLMRANEANPTGHWERLDVTQANDRILEAMGGCWYDVGTLAAIEDLEDEKLRALKEELRYVVLGLDAHRPWMLKDPRLCLVLPLWLTVLDNPVFILTHRDPEEVARSLERRDGFPREVSLALWEAYVLSSLRASAGRPRLLVRYDELLERPHETVQRLHDWLVGQGVERLRMPTESEIAAFVDVRLQRSQSVKGRELRLPPWISSVLRVLEHEESWEQDALPELSAESSQTLRLYAPLRRSLERTEEKLAVSNRRRDELSGFEERFHQSEERQRMQLLLLEQCERQLRESECQLRESERQLRESERQLRESERQLRESERQLQESERQLRESERQLQEKENQIRSLEATRQEVEQSLREKEEVLAEATRGLTSLERRRARLERAVSELDELIDGLLRSRIWRMGRWLTWPRRVSRPSALSEEERRSSVMEHLAGSDEV